MESSLPFSQSVISRLQRLTIESYYREAEINDNPAPTITQLDTVAAAENQHKLTVAKNLGTLDELIKKQEDSIRDLQSRLENLRRRDEITPQKIELAQATALKNGARSCFQERPWLSEEDSGVNTLLALRSVLKVIEQGRKGISEKEKRIGELRSDVSREREWVATANQIDKELRRKIAELEAVDKMNEGEAERERRKMEEYETARKEMAAISSKLIRELGRFVKAKLGVMVAVEESGGPVVGSELDTETLKTHLEVEEVGSTRKGKAAKARERGQKRLDELWGGGGDDDGPIDTEKKAGEELLSLIEAMLNKMLEDEPHAYTALSRDSAASRFLVRSFVATLHPRDAMKIRLLDFAGRIEGGR